MTAGIKRIRSADTVYEYTKVPKELWEIFAVHLSATADLKHVTAFALTHTEFYKLCLNSCLRFRIRNAFGSLSKVTAEVLKQQVPIFVCEIGNEKIDLIDRGRYFIQHSPHLFFIMQPAMLSYSVLDLAEEMNQHPELVVSDQQSGIMTCFATEKGFLAVTYTGCIFWNWTPNGFVFDQQAVLISNGMNSIVSSCVSHNKLLVSTEMGSLYVLEIKGEMTFFPVSNATNHDCWGLESIADSPYMWLQRLANSDEILSRLELMQSNGEYKLVLKEALITEENLTGCWPINFGHQNSYHLESEAQSLFGQEAKIVWPNAKVYEQCRVYDDFLFLSYKDGSFYLFDMLQKRECQFESTVLKSYLKANNSILYWLGLSYDQGVNSLVILFQKENEEKKWSLYSLTIPFYI